MMIVIHQRRSHVDVVVDADRHAVAAVGSVVRSCPGAGGDNKYAGDEDDERQYTELRHRCRHHHTYNSENYSN
jgi:hypothetical protein